MACEFTAPLAEALSPPRLNIARQSLVMSLNISLAAAMPAATALTGGVVPAAAAVQALAVQPRLATMAVTTDDATWLASVFDDVSTFCTAPLSACETSAPPAPLPTSLIDEVLAASDSALTTQSVFSPPLLKLPQPKAPSLASCDTEASITASFCCSGVALATDDTTATLRGSKPSNWLTVDSAWVTLPAVTPPLALVAADTAISENGVTVTEVLTLPAAAGTSRARIVKPAGSGWAWPVTSSACVVLAVAVILTT